MDIVSKNTYRVFPFNVIIRKL
uniref:Uncharacterized protein n=1 Tax=Anguilla anguilla TaxID=7936 RepID=A0A0E9VCH2_ANGAN